MYHLFVDFLSQKRLQTFLFWFNSKIFVKTENIDSYDIISQLNYTKLISLWFSTTSPNFIPLLIVLELWAVGTFHPPPPPPQAEPPSKSPGGIGLRDLQGQEITSVLLQVQKY